MKYTKKEFLELPNCPKINVATSVNNMLTFGFSDVFGTRYKLKTLEDFVTQVEKVSNYSFGDVTFEEPYFIISEDATSEATLAEEMGDVIEASIQDVQEVLDGSEVIVPEETETVSGEATVDESAVVEVSNKRTVDWLWVNDLTNSKEDRLALDNYAEENFNIKLKRTMRIENMLKAFKEQLVFLGVEIVD